MEDKIEIEGYLIADNPLNESSFSKINEYRCSLQDRKGEVEAILEHLKGHRQNVVVKVKDEEGKNEREKEVESRPSYCTALVISGARSVGKKTFLGIVHASIWNDHQVFAGRSKPSRMMSQFHIWKPIIIGILVKVATLIQVQNLEESISMSMSFSCEAELVQLGLTHVASLLASELTILLPLFDRIIIPEEDDIVDNEHTAKLSGKNRLIKSVELLTAILQIATDVILLKSSPTAPAMIISM